MGMGPPQIFGLQNLCRRERGDAEHALYRSLTSVVVACISRTSEGALRKSSCSADPLTTIVHPLAVLGVDSLKMAPWYCH